MPFELAHVDTVRKAGAGINRNGLAGRGLAVAIVSDHPAGVQLFDVLDQAEQFQLTNWLDDPLPRTGGAA